ncbi:MAG: DUF2889 domain-containing protein [Deltaproteobacteria bacterium]|nr:DUF2889 domain-containing protein [Deltaproteobacteria bacterium]
MITLDKAKQQKIHTRQIDIATYEGTSGSIIVEGLLRDERLLESYRPTGVIHPPGTIHHMIIRIEIEGPQLVIEDIDVEMPTIPHDACIETLESLAPIKGMSIVSGFTAKVKDLVGGTKGCCHLLALLMAMAPAAVQGAWSAMAREPIDPDVYLPMAMARVKNTCWVWRDDGPLMKEWNAEI